MILDTFVAQDVGGRVRAFSDGAETLDYFFGPRGCLDKGVINLPKLILLDLKLHKGSGLEILKRIKSDKRTSVTPAGIRECYMA